MKKRVKPSFLRTNFISIILFVVLMSVLGYQVYLSQLKLSEEQARRTNLLREREELLLETELKQDQLKQSQSPEYIERLARDKLKMVKPNEIIYYIDKGSR